MRAEQDGLYAVLCNSQFVSVRPDASRLGRTVVSPGGDMAWAKITRQWDDGTVVVVETGSDLDSLADIVTAIVELDAQVFADGDG